MRRVWMAALAAGLWSLSAWAEQAPLLKLENVWVRALPSSQHNTAAYMTIINPGATAIAVVGASCNIADRAELHKTRLVDGMMRMEPLDGLALAPGERVELAPGGTHLMLMGLKYMPAPGDNVQLCLKLATGEEACTAADVRSASDAAEAHDPKQN